MTEKKRLDRYPGKIVHSFRLPDVQIKYPGYDRFLPLTATTSYINMVVGGNGFSAQLHSQITLPYALSKGDQISLRFKISFPQLIRLVSHRLFIGKDLLFSDAKFPNYINPEWTILKGTTAKERGFLIDNPTKNPVETPQHKHFRVISQVQADKEKKDGQS